MTKTTKVLRWAKKQGWRPYGKMLKELGYTRHGQLIAFLNRLQRQRKCFYVLEERGRGYRIHLYSAQ